MGYIKKQLEARGTHGGYVAFRNGLQPVCDIMVPLSRGYRPLVWLARVIGVREPDRTQIASTQDRGGAEINHRDGSGLRRTTKIEGVWRWGS